MRDYFVILILVSTLLFVQPTYSVKGGPSDCSSICYNPSPSFKTGDLFRWERTSYIQDDFPFETWEIYQYDLEILYPINDLTESDLKVLERNHLRIHGVYPGIRGDEPLYVELSMFLSQELQVRLIHPTTILTNENEIMNYYDYLLTVEESGIGEFGNTIVEFTQERSIENNLFSEYSTIYQQIFTDVNRLELIDTVNSTIERKIDSKTGLLHYYENLIFNPRNNEIQGFAVKLIQDNETLDLGILTEPLFLIPAIIAIAVLCYGFYYKKSIKKHSNSQDKEFSMK